MKRPWTADYSRAAFAAELASPVFFLVNMMISGLWAALFLVDSAILALQLGGLATTAVFVFGALASIYGPNALIRFALERQIAKSEDYRWPRRASIAGLRRIGRRRRRRRGIGGLTAAAVLADSGLKVAVYEAHVVPGAIATRSCARRATTAALPPSFRRRPARFLRRPSRRADRHDPDPAWRRRSARLGRLDHPYRFADRIIEPPRDWRAYAAELGRQFPADAAGLKALFEEIKAIYDGMAATGVDNGGIPGLPRSADALLAFAATIRSRAMDG